MMMKSSFLLFLAMAVTMPTLAKDEYIDQVPDRFYETQQSQQALLKRAELCIVQTIKCDEVRTTGSSTGFTGLFGGGQRQEAIVAIPALPLVKFKDVESGVIYINNRIDYKADFLMHNVQTEMTLAMKDNKFKIGNKEIKYLQKDAGYGTPPEYKPLPAKRFGSSLPDDTVKAINQVTEKLAACLTTIPNDKW